jgi:hypothetical protein
MTLKVGLRAIGSIAFAAILCSCATRPENPPTPTASTTSVADSPAASSIATDNREKPAPAGQTHYKWSRATEADVAAQLDKKFEEAAKSFVQLKRNDQLMFCKKYKEMGSTIRTLHCITEAELRKQVEDSDELRANMRNRMGKCTGGQPVACSAGQ